MWQLTIVAIFSGSPCQHRIDRHHQPKGDRIIDAALVPIGHDLTR
jgi:hypothetical protein